MLKFVFRINKERTRITGAICGLGYIESTGYPILPEHDMEVVFDVEFSKEDIQAVIWSLLFITYFDYYSQFLLDTMTYPSLIRNIFIFQTPWEVFVGVSVPELKKHFDLEAVNLMKYVTLLFQYCINIASMLQPSNAIMLFS